MPPGPSPLPRRAAAAARGAAAVALLLLAACGFEPLYGERTGSAEVADDLRYVHVPPIEERVGQLVRIELVNRLVRQGSAPQPRYRLEVKLTESKQGLAVRRDATATRANLIVSANYVLRPAGEGTTDFAGTVQSVNGYDILDNEFATLSAEADARQRAARDIALAIVERLAIWFRNAPKEARS